VEKLLNMEEYRKSQNVSVYVSMKGEVDTTAILENALSQGACLDKVECSLGRKELLCTSLARYENGTSLLPG